ncbi:MAG: hypothetical protein ACM3SM_14305 [Bacteroidota bacterium]
MNIRNMLRNTCWIACCALSITSCSPESGSGKTDATQSEKTSPDTTASPSAVTSAPRSFHCNGYILSAYRQDKSCYVLIDTVEYYSGGEARKKIALEQKHNRKTESFEGFYLRNTRVDSIRIKLPDNSKIILQTFSRDSSGNYRFNERTDARKFYKLISSDEFRNSGFKIFSFDIADDKIILLKEIYIP